MQGKAGHEGEAWKGGAKSVPPAVPASLDRSVGADARDEGPNEEELVRELQLAFAPIDKLAFGIAVGVASALVVVSLTLFHLLLAPDSAGVLRLLGQYFYGYTVSPQGVFIGGFWGFVVGFVMGWFAAFCRNLAIAISVFISRTRAELAETREFLDHI